MKRNKLFLVASALLTLTSCGNNDALIGDTKLNDEIYHTCSLIYLDELKFFASFNFEDGIDYVSFKEANLDEFLKNRNFITGKDKKTGATVKYQCIVNVDANGSQSADYYKI